MDTLATMRRQLIHYLKDDEDVQLCNDAISDAVESLWQSIILISLQQFLGGPVANLSLAAGTERATIVSVPDPVALVGGNVTQVANTSGQPNLAARTILFGITYITESGSETLPDYLNLSGGGNGAPLSVNVGLGQLSVVALPSNNIPTGDPVGWNLYASGLNAAGAPDPGNMVRQNDQPIPFGQTWNEPPNGVNNLGNPDLQPPVQNSTADNIFYLRILEVQNPDQTWTRWQGAELDGLMMDRAVKNIAPQSTYQRYAFDFVRGNTIEIRPALGQQLNPRYFFIQKPRRLIFDSAIIPFQNLSYTEFIKVYAAAQCRRAAHEYTAASQDGNVAETVRVRILQGMNTQATRKQKYITPFTY